MSAVRPAGKLLFIHFQKSFVSLNCTASLYAPLSSFNFIFSISKNRLIFLPFAKSICVVTLICDCVRIVSVLHLFLSPS